MSTLDYQRVTTRRRAKLYTPPSAESHYWSKFASPVTLKELDAVPCVTFHPLAPHDLAVCSATRIQLYDGKTRALKKSISRTKEAVTTASFRPDGALLVAGDASGLIQVHDIANRGILRSLREHKGAIRAASFLLHDKTKLLSASDDRMLKLWDMPTGQSTLSISAHDDYVRAAVQSTASPDLVLTGSYDGTARLWDVRAGGDSGPTHTLAHGAPVEAVALLGGGALAVSAGGPVVRVWDLLSGGRLLHTIEAHQRTVTSLVVDSVRGLLLTGSLDGHVKVIRADGFGVEHTFVYPGPVLSLALAPDHGLLAAGLADGHLVLRRNEAAAKAEAVAQREALAAVTRASAPPPNTRRYFARGPSFLPEPDSALVVRAHRAKRLKAYDHFLKRFQYGRALDACLGKEDAAIVAGVLEELVHRGGLAAALAGRDEASLQPVAHFVLKFIADPRYTALLCTVATVFLDLYGGTVGRSPVLDELLMKLRERLRVELRLQDELASVIGSLDMLMATSQTLYA